MNNRYLRHKNEIRQKFAKTYIDAARIALTEALKTPASLALIYTDLQEAALALENIPSEQHDFLKAYTLYIQLLAEQTNTLLDGKVIKWEELVTKIDKTSKLYDHKIPAISLDEFNAKIANKDAVIDCSSLYMSVCDTLLPLDPSNTDNFYRERKCQTILESADFELMRRTLISITGNADLAHFEIDLRNAMLVQRRIALVDAIRSLNREAPNYQNDLNEVKKLSDVNLQRMVALLNLSQATPGISIYKAITNHLEHVRKYSADLCAIHQFDTDDAEYLAKFRSIKTDLTNAIKEIGDTTDILLVKRLLQYHYTLAVVYKDISFMAKTKETSDVAFRNLLIHINEYLNIHNKSLEAEAEADDELISMHTHDIEIFKAEMLSSASPTQRVVALAHEHKNVDENDYRKRFNIYDDMAQALLEMTDVEKQEALPLSLTNVYAATARLQVKLGDKLLAIRSYKTAINCGNANRSSYTALLALIDEELTCEPAEFQTLHLRRDRAYYQEKLDALGPEAVVTSSAASLARSSSSLFGATLSRSNSEAFVDPDPSPLALGKRTADDDQSTSSSKKARIV